MELAVEASRSGQPSCRAGSVLLHSAWDPVKEASRFVDGALDKRSPSCFILSGPCLDYISPILRSRFPAATILSIQHDVRFREGRRDGADPVWYPDLAQDREAFLEANLSEEAMGGIQVLTWQPAAMAWPREAEDTARAIRTVLDRFTSSQATLRSFGRRWIANACRNILLIDRVLAPSKIDCPIVVAAAGPSLRDALGLLEPWREGFVLLAVSSALAACRKAGMEPDLVVATDGGFWSRHHLYPLAERPSPLAMPLTALPSAFLEGKAPRLILTQGNFPEPELAAMVGGAIELPGHGTVTGSALHLAARLCSGLIIAAGLDLAGRDILSHASPHGFDTITREAQTRLAPGESLIYERELPLLPLRLSETPWRSSRSLAIYAAALETDARRLLFAGRLRRLLPSPLHIEGFPDLDAASLAAVMGSSARPAHFLDALPLASAATRRESLALRLEEWLDLSRMASEELGHGLLPASLRARELLRAIDLPWYAAACRAIAAGDGAGAAARALGDESRHFLESLKERLL